MYATSTSIIDRTRLRRVGRCRARAGGAHAACERAHVRAPGRGRARFQADRGGRRGRRCKRGAHAAMAAVGIDRHRGPADRSDPRSRRADVGGVHPAHEKIGGMRRVAYVLGGLVVAWLVTLLIVDSVYATGYGERVGGRVGESLGGQATIAVTDLALVRGYVEM